MIPSIGTRDQNIIDKAIYAEEAAIMAPPPSCDALVENPLMLVTQGKYADALEAFGSLPQNSYRTALYREILDVLLSKLRECAGSETERYIALINAFACRDPVPSRDQKILEAAARSLELATFLVKATYRQYQTEVVTKLKPDWEADLPTNIPSELEADKTRFLNRFQTTNPILEATLFKTLELYKFISDRTWRCVFLNYIFANAFYFPAPAFTPFPISHFKHPNPEFAASHRRSYDEARNIHLVACARFQNAYMANIRDRVIAQVVAHHLHQNDIPSAICILKQFCDKDKCETALLNMARERFNADKRISFVTVLLEIPNARPLFADQTAVNVCLLEAFQAAVRQNDRELCFRIYHLLPEEIKDQKIPDPFNRG